MGRLRIFGLVACIAASVWAGAASADETDDPFDAVTHRGDRFVPKPAGTVENLQFWFGPYTVGPGQDMNRIDVDLPVRDGFILAIEPGMRRVADLSEPSHQEAHIHHSHWFALDPGNQEDNYTYGNTEWIFGNGDEETRADFQERSAADPDGPIYGQYVGATGPQLMIYMLHNKTSQPLNVYIALDVTFKHGTRDELAALGGRPHHDVSGVLFGRTYDVPREPEGDGIYESTKDSPRGAIEWTSTVEGTIVGTGGHLHPGGMRVVVENMGSRDNPCPDDGRGYGGTQLLVSEALFRNAPFSEDFQMSVTHPAWRAPIHRGDVIRITGVYENKEHGWYDVMTHEGLYIDEAQPPRGRCAPELIGAAGEPQMRIRRHRHRRVRHVRHVHRRADGTVVRHRHRRVVIRRHRHRVRVAPEVTAGVPNRPWSEHEDVFCGEQYGGPPCDQTEDERPPGHFADTVTIANFVYSPGDRSLAGADGAPVRVRRGSSLRFVNADQFLNIRHSVTTCAWPCNGPYVANYPFPDGRWDSGTLGYDLVDGGNPNPVASTPPDLEAGKYAYFCRIHPWMRGAFEVVD